MLVGVVPAKSADAHTEFEQMYRTHYRFVERYVLGNFPTVDSADVISRTFETAWRRFNQIPADATRGWLVAVARNCAMNLVRASRRRDKYTQDYRAAFTRWHHDLHQFQVPRDTFDALRNAFETLQPSDQELILLTTWDGLTGADLGEALGITAAAAAVRLFRARQRFKVAFDRLGGAA